MKERILVAEDNADMRNFIEEVLEDAGYQPITAADGRVALAQVERAEDMVDLVITDVQMPGASGDQLLAVVRQKRPETPVIVITAFGSIEQAVELVKGGAFQYLTKPFETPDLLQTVTEALDRSAPQRAQAKLRREAPAPPARIIGASRPMRALFEMINVSARSNSNVLVIGETGTGKELVARAIHEVSNRKGAFVPVNCAAIPADLVESELFGHMGGSFTGAKQARAGLFEAAEGGTLLLDEIGELPLAMQPKLLRTLQEGAVRRVGSNAERPINVRVVAATNRNLEKEIEAGRFREDLFWRLNVIRIKVPPLRERPLDIPLLVEHFLEKNCQMLQREPLDVSPEALAILTAYAWPGNVRELENAIERATAFCHGTTLTPEVLPERVRTTGDAATLVARSSAQNLPLREIEREYIFEILRRTEGNKKRAAEILGMDRKTLYRKLDEYGSTESAAKNDGDK
ncbi:MAG: sigma-54-dependent Fis family transcriptional regulator [Acidobacteria bacterium]|nr:sigma-54-dependent Fis family transcriptional regulator [Acidobacteriota bacterium]